MKWRKLNSPNAQTYLGTLKSDDEIYIVQESEPEMLNLSHFLDSQNKFSFPLEKKLKIAIQIAKCMKSMYEIEGLHHGHLCANNILVRKLSFA